MVGPRIRRLTGQRTLPCAGNRLQGGIPVWGRRVSLRQARRAPDCGVPVSGPRRAQAAGTQGLRAADDARAARTAPLPRR